MTLIEQIVMRKPLMTKQETEKKIWFCPFLLFPHTRDLSVIGAGRILGRDTLYKLKTKRTSVSQETYIWVGRQLDHFQLDQGTLQILAKKAKALLQGFASATIRTHTPSKPNEARNCDETGRYQTFSVAKHVFLSIKTLHRLLV